MRLMLPIVLFAALALSIAACDQTDSSRSTSISSGPLSRHSASAFWASADRMAEEGIEGELVCGGDSLICCKGKARFLDLGPSPDRRRRECRPKPRAGTEIPHDREQGTILIDNGTSQACQGIDTRRFRCRAGVLALSSVLDAADTYRSDDYAPPGASGHRPAQSDT